MILITGGTGMVGHHLLAALLKTGEPIKAIYRTEEKRKQATKRIKNLLNNESEKNLIWVKADLNDITELTTAFEGVDKVYHCAGLVSFDIRDKDKLRKINIEGTANMVNLALSFKVKKFCHLSSVAALGSELNNKPIREKSLRNNATFHDYYDISKFGGEIEVWRGSQEGLDVVIVNPAIIIGAGNWHSGSGQLFSRVAKGFPFRIPKKSGFVDVDDVVNIMMNLMNSPIKNKRYILVSACERIDKITDLIAENLQCKAPHIKIRKWMLWGLWIGQSIGYLFGGKKEINKQTIQLLYKDVNFDNSKIKEALSFEFTPIEKAIAKTAKQYLIENKKS